MHQPHRDGPRVGGRRRRARAAPPEASERSYRALLTAAGLASVAMGAAVAREALVG